MKCGLRVTVPLRRGILGAEAVGGREAGRARQVRGGSEGGPHRHPLTPCIFEVFGGAELAAVNLFNDWAARARGKTPPGEEPPWCARNYVPYWSQILSKAAQQGAAEEIIARVREEAHAREAQHARGG